MQLQETHIEGLVSGRDYDLTDDTPISGVQAWFAVVAEKVKNFETGLYENKNFVYWHYTMELGRSSGRRRTRDKVKFNEVTGKWEVLELAKRGSDIKRFTAEWNAFARGVSTDTIGTPLDNLFPNDPARISHYKANHVHTVERLSNLPDSDIANLGMGARADQDKAKKYLARLEAMAPSAALEAAMAQKDKQIESLSRQVADLTDKLTTILQAQIEAAGEAPAPAKRGRPKATESVPA